MSAPDHQRKTTATRALLERQALAFHYEHCRRTTEPAFPPDLVLDITYPGGMGVIYMASTGARMVALYGFEPTDIGYRFRRLTTEIEGRELKQAVIEAASDAPLGLAALGLSIREISAITSLSRSELLSRLAGV